MQFKAGGKYRHFVSPMLALLALVNKICGYTQPVAKTNTCLGYKSACTFLLCFFSFTDLRGELDKLTSRIQQTDSIYNTVCTAQQQYEFTCAKYNQKLKSAQVVIEEQITPEQGLSVMQEKITSVEVLEYKCVQF